MFTPTDFEIKQPILDCGFIEDDQYIYVASDDKENVIKFDIFQIDTQELYRTFYVNLNHYNENIDDFTCVNSFGNFLCLYILHKIHIFHVTKDIFWMPVHMMEVPNPINVHIIGDDSFIVVRDNRMIKNKMVLEDDGYHLRTINDVQFNDCIGTVDYDYANKYIITTSNSRIVCYITETFEKKWEMVNKFGFDICVGNNIFTINHNDLCSVYDIETCEKITEFDMLTTTYTKDLYTMIMHDDNLLFYNNDYYEIVDTNTKEVLESHSAHMEMEEMTYDSKYVFFEKDNKKVLYRIDRYHEELTKSAITE